MSAVAYARMLVIVSFLVSNILFTTVVYLLTLFAGYSTISCGQEGRLGYPSEQAV